MSSDKSSITVLCVDDEPGLADLIATHIERHDNQIIATTATSAREGFDHLQTEAIDCIVSEYDMRGIDGLEFLETLRAEQSEFPFILFTGRGSEKIASDAISASVTDYIQKGTGTDQYQVLAQCIRDVVERHRARTQQAESDQRARTVLNASPDAVLVSVDTEYVFANPSAVELFNADSTDDLIGRPILDLVHPDDRDDMQAEIQSVATGEQTVTRVGRTVQTLDGQTVPVEVTERQITWDGQDGIVAIIRDLSTPEELARTQQRYRTAFEKAFDAMVIFNDDQQIVDVNQSACDLFGRSRDNIIGAPISKVVSQGFDLEAAWEEFKAADQVQGKAPIQRPGTETRITEYAATADIVSGNHLNILRDVTEREEYIDQIEAQNEKLEQFATIISHDLRNPLNVAQGRAKLAQEEIESEHLDAAVTALERSFVLIEDILTLAREGEQVSETEPVDLGATIEECYKTVEMDEATLTIETGQTIQADRSRLQELVENLIRNAVEHGGNGVSVTVGALDDGFYVADNGPGIPEEDRERIFEAGYSTDSEGTGYGLQIVREIATGHGWDVRVTESGAGGARFEIAGVESTDG